MSTICGVDIASTKFDYRIISERSNDLGKGTVHMDKVSFENFFSSVPEDTTFVLESTGGYHITTEYFLRSKCASVCVENPLILKRFISSQTLRRTKTDTLDALSIARYGLINYDRLHKKDSVMDEVNKTIARRRQEVAEDIARAKTQLKADLNKGWPELLAIDVFTNAILDILTTYGGPSNVARATDEELEEVLYGKHGRKTNLTAKNLKDLAKDSIGIPAMEIIVRDSVGKLRDLQKRSDDLTAALLSHEKEVHAQEMEILTSFPGIGEITAAHFMSEIEDIHKFSTYQKLIAFVGTDPSIYQSGKYSGGGHITKHGDRSLRKYVFLMAQKSIQFNPVLSEYYEKKINEGFQYRKAVVAVMNKLLKLIYTLLTRGEKFELK